MTKKIEACTKQDEVSSQINLNSYLLRNIKIIIYKFMCISFSKSNLKKN